MFDVLLLYIYADREAGGPGGFKLIKHSNIDHLDPNVPGKYLLTTRVVYREEKGLHTGLDSQQKIYGTPYELSSVFSLAASLLISI